VIGKATEALALYIPKCNAGNNWSKWGAP
jgi:hypothetical protein